ncbi:hypothetical protein LCM00_20595 [Bacillus infantis]|uniref:hypothetical protein n=1 Tax=Bacillus infantis TaxID=324767 RepID=UPI001CD5773C|nr:hypothetical protein [Bacillus infantis]MCA1041899.1 hypothetical protein [Bacillus infantis]
MSRRTISREMKKTSKSIHMEEWIWELSGHIQPCRSGAIKELFLDRIRTELVKEGLIDEDAVITKKHGELFAVLMEKRAKSCG